MAGKSKARSKSGKARSSSSSRAAEDRASGRTKARKAAPGPRDANRTKKIGEMKTLLLHRRDELLNGMEQSRRFRASPPISKGDSSDLAANSLDSDTAMQLAETGSSELAQINEALQNMDDGTYGQCTVCGGDIPLARLEALPYASLCVRCKEDQERSDGSGASTTGWSAVDELEDLEQDMG